MNDNEPIPQGHLDEPPDWLTDDQKNGWRYAIEHAPRGLLRFIDRSALTVWVIAEDLHAKASQQVAKFGLITKSPTKGEPMQNPYLPIINKQAQIMLKTASELGFTPSSRSRVSLAHEQSEGPKTGLAAFR